MKEYIEKKTYFVIALINRCGIGKPITFKVQDRNLISTLAKFRLSCHNLETEKGRHCKPVTPVDQRLCQICKVVEDEEHFLMYCTKYDSIRNILFSYRENNGLHNTL